METNLSLVKLSCPNCGAALEITADIDRFACAHCGKQIIVQRAGGAISLQPVTDRLDALAETTKRIDAATQSRALETANVARELQVARLRQDIVLLTLQKQSKKPDDKTYRQLGSALVIGVVALVIAYFARGQIQTYALWCGGITLGLVVLTLVLLTTKLSPYDRQIKRKQNEINQLLNPAAQKRSSSYAPAPHPTSSSIARSKQSSSFTPIQRIAILAMTILVLLVFMAACFFWSNLSTR